MKIPKILWHHGTCDCCNKKFIMVCHFGYDQQPRRDYRVCDDCLKKEAWLVVVPQPESKSRNSGKNELLKNHYFNFTLSYFNLL